METLEQQIFPDWLEQLQSCPQEYPASRRVLPGSDEAIKMTVGSGHQCSMLLDQSSPLGAFSRILLESPLFTRSEEYCYVWQVWDTRLGLSAFQLTLLGQSTDDSGCSLWRTPDASIVTGGAANGEDRIKQGHALGLHDQVNTAKLWPTARATDWKAGNNKTGRSDSAQADKAGWNLLEAAKLWPTPTAALSESGGSNCSGKRHPENLASKAKTLWPTPNGGNFNDGENLETWEVRRQKNKEKWNNGNGHGTPLAIAAKMSDCVSGSLNPRFVEELMGFPIDHTALKR
jgi:hypothetical protein